MEEGTYHCQDEFVHQVWVVGQLVVRYVGWQLGHLDGDIAVSLLFAQLNVLDELLHLNALVGLLRHERKVNPLDHVRQVVQLILDLIVFGVHMVHTNIQNFLINRVIKNKMARF